jgi:hypothetical protein
MMTADDLAANAVDRFNDGVDNTGINIVEASEDVDDAEVNAHVNNGVNAEANNTKTGVTNGGTSGNLADFWQCAEQSSQESASSFDLPV